MKQRTMAGLRAWTQAFFEVWLLGACVFLGSLAIAAVCSKVIPPRWLAPGWPSVHGYPKNIEERALFLSLLAAPAIGLLFGRVHSRRWLSVGVAMTLLGLYLTFREQLATMSAPAVILAVTTWTFVLSLFVYQLELPAREPAESAATRRRNLRILVAVTALAVIGKFLFTLATLYFGGVDALHHGEIFTSAADFLRGGKPFLSHYWPHGLHDTGLAALVFRLTGSVSYRNVLVAMALFSCVSMITVALIAHGLELGGYAALIVGVLALAHIGEYTMLIAHQLFVVVGFWLFSRQRPLWAGAVMFFAHLYRIEAGLYGFMAVFAYVGVQLLLCALSGRFDAMRPHLRRAALFFAGALGVALLCRLLLGWPDATWYRIAFTILPRYHRDSTGFAYPIPYHENPVLAEHEPGQVLAALGIVIVCLVMLAVAARRLYAAHRSGAADSFFGRPFPLLLIFLSALTLKSAFGRSDWLHIAYSAALVFLVLSLFAARAFVYSALPRSAKVALVVIFFAAFHFAEGTFSMKPLRSGWSVTTFARLFDIYKDYAHPVPPVRDCSAGLLSPLQARVYDELEGRLCATRQILESHGLRGRELLIGHAASLFYPFLGFELPTRYYFLGWAITGDMQADLVADLERSGVRAVLRCDRHGIPEYDIPDSVRIPIFHRWFASRFDTAHPIATPLGELYLRRD